MLVYQTARTGLIQTKPFNIRKTQISTTYPTTSWENKPNNLYNCLWHSSPVWCSCLLSQCHRTQKSVNVGFVTGILLCYPSLGHIKHLHILLSSKITFCLFQKVNRNIWFLHYQHFTFYAIVNPHKNAQWRNSRHAAPWELGLSLTTFKSRGGCCYPSVPSVPIPWWSWCNSFVVC